MPKQPDLLEGIRHDAARDRPPDTPPADAANMPKRLVCRRTSGTCTSSKRSSSIWAPPALELPCVVRKGVAQGTQAVAVELGTDELTVGKNQGGGAVPRFGLLREGGERVADVAREQWVFFEGGRNHGQHGFFGGEAFEEAKLETVIEAGGIADVFFEEREPRADGEARTEFGGFGAEPAAVGDEGVDFAVVGDVAEGLREVPGRLRVG